MSRTDNPNANTPRVGGCSQEWSEKLPWYVNETLSPEESSRVETHLQSCLECRKEVAELKAIKEAVMEGASQTPEPSEAVFERVMERIEAYEARSLKPARLVNRIKAWLPSPGLIWQPALRPAVAVAGLVIIVQALAIAGLLAFGTPSPGYKTLTGPAGVEVSGFKAKIAFRQDATEKAIRELLRQVDASIVSGPTALGIYTVAFPPDVPGEQSREDIIARLRSHKDVVRFIERLP